MIDCVTKLCCWFPRKLFSNIFDGNKTLYIHKIQVWWYRCLVYSNMLFLFASARRWLKGLYATRTSHTEITSFITQHIMLSDRDQDTGKRVDERVGSNVPNFGIWSKGHIINTMTIDIRKNYGSKSN